MSVPLRKGNYYYYERTLEGEEYVRDCRRLAFDDGAPLSVYHTMPTAPPEHVILDENAKAKQHTYYSVHAFKVSPNNKLVAYAQDTKGDEIYTIHIIDAQSLQPVEKPLVGVTCNVEWAGNGALLYTTLDQILRPDKVWLHNLGTEQSSDSCLYHEEDEKFGLDLYISESEKFLFVASGSKTTMFVFYLDTSKPEEGLKVLTPRTEGGLPEIVVYRLPAIGLPLENLSGGRKVDFVDPVYDVHPVESQFFSNVLRFSYSSLRTPPSVYDYDMDSGECVLKKTDTVLGGFDSSNYLAERKWVTASDGTDIPLSVVYRKDLVKLDGSDPLLLYGYGSYEICIDPAFKASRLSLLDRGFIFVIAHIRGGGELENKYCSKEKLCIHGRSAGGLLIGGVLNMRPDLFKAAVLGVPFVDVVTTMLDPTIPLTTAEWEEWGDPREKEFYFYMKSYSPVDNVKAQNYPHILVTAGLHDPRVMYSEPAKFVAKLRELKTDDNTLLFKCEFGAGHFAKSGRFEKLQDDALTFTFLLKILNMIPAHETA
uniref:Prolyl endopeptidase n=1 Tax=Chenopodium quinoa TaxID=63459 RepID=A0A803LS22_CHEQI